MFIDYQLWNGLPLTHTVFFIGEEITISVFIVGFKCIIPTSV